MERRKMFIKIFFFTGNLNKEQVRLGQVLQDKENIIQVRIWNIFNEINWNIFPVPAPGDPATPPPQPGELGETDQLQQEQQQRQLPSAETREECGDTELQHGWQQLISRWGGSQIFSVKRKYFLTTKIFSHNTQFLLIIGVQGRLPSSVSWWGRCRLIITRRTPLSPPRTPRMSTSAGRTSSSKVNNLNIIGILRI